MPRREWGGCAGAGGRGPQPAGRPRALQVEPETGRRKRQGRRRGIVQIHVVPAEVDLAAAAAERALHVVYINTSLVTSMGRMASHTAQIITLDDMMNAKQEFAPDVDKLESFDSPAPLQLKADGTYPMPMPGMLKDREY